MQIVTNIVTKNDCYKSGRTIAPKGIMIHSVGVAQPNPDVFVNQFNRSGLSACVHAFLSDSKIVQTLPWNWRAWHCGSGENGSANNTHISIECCEPSGHTYQGGTMIGYDVHKNKLFFDGMYRNLVELCASLCNDYDLNPLQDGVIICHAEGHQRGIASNHGDVLQWFPKHGVTMDDLRQDIQKELTKMQEQRIREIFQEELQKMAAEPQSAWAGEIMKKAIQSGITDGSRPRSFATREEVVAMCNKVLEVSGNV